MAPFYGKYRGTVVDNRDPLRLGRIQPVVPAISETSLNWAMPNAPFAGPGVGMFALPPVGANVWIEFEGGDPDYPIWTGCFWGQGEAPADSAVPTSVVLKTKLVTLIMDDLSGTCTLEMNSPGGVQTVELSSDGIKLISGAATVVVAPNRIGFKNAATSLGLTPSSIDLQNGASSIAMSPASVNINNGALEVM